MIALSCFLFTFVCLAHSRQYYYGHSNHGSQGVGFCHGKANGNYRDPDNCYGYIACLNQIVFKMNCPDDLKYDEKTDRCDWPQNVQCSSGCQEGSTSYDECGQKCTCTGGQLANCVRIRKEFTSLTNVERRRHIDTIIQVSTDERYRAEYVELINEHYELFCGSIHKKEHFIPWHRYYILRYENLMRKADCSFTVTYWDWSLDSRDPFGTGPENFWNSNTGFGGDGADAENCVLDGPFRKGVWSRVRPESAGIGPHCLMRKFSGIPPEEVDVMEVLKSDDFEGFEWGLRVLLHNNVHCQVGAVMCSNESASAPEFFLHHSFIDKIWDDWQKKSVAHKYAYFPTVRENMPGTDLYPDQLIDLSNQPGGVSVEYEPFQPEENIRKKVAGLKSSQLLHYRRRPFNGLSLEAIRLFKISLDEVKKIRKFEKLLDPKVIQP